MKRKILITAIVSMLLMLQMTSFIEARPQSEATESSYSYLPVNTPLEDSSSETSELPESQPSESSEEESSAVSSEAAENSQIQSVPEESSRPTESAPIQNEISDVITSQEPPQTSEDLSKEESDIQPERNNELWNDEMAVTLTMACDWVRNSDAGDLYFFCMGSAGKPALSKLVNQYITEVYLKQDYPNILNLSYDVLNVTFCGYNAENIYGKNIIQNITEYMDYDKEDLYVNAYSLLAVDSNQYEISSIAKNSRKNMITRILNFQNTDGGFGNYVGNSSSVVQTALAISALSPYRDQEEVASALNRAMTYLQNNQEANGSFYENGKPSTSAVAKVIVALNCMGISIDDPRFVKNGENLSQVLLRYVSLDGGFQEGEQEGSDVGATENAILALTSIKNGRSPYRLTDLLVDDSSEDVSEEEKKVHDLGWVQFVWSVLMILAALFVTITTIRVKIRDKKDGHILSEEEKYILYRIKEENPDKEEDNLKK